MSKKLRSQIIVVFSVFLMIFMASCAPDPEIPPLFEPTRDPVLEEEIIEELSGINPEAVPLYREATRVMDEGDYDTSFSLYQELAVLVPEFSTTYRRLSYAESARGNYASAIEFARKGVELEPIAFNKSALAWALLEDGSPKASREAFNLASSAVEEIPDDEQAQLVLMLSAWLAYEDEAMRASNERLLELMPGYSLVHYVAGILAATDGKWFKAEKELIIAQALGMPPEAIQEVMDSGLARNLKIIRIMIWSVLAITIWLIGLGILYWSGKLLSRITIEALKKESPTIQSQLTDRERKIRSTYRWVIRILSLYFYLSIPFVVAAVFVLAGLAYFFFSLVGFIPIYIAFLLGAALLISLIVMLGALFQDVKDVPPGILLDRDRVPQLWSLNDRVAQLLDVKSVDAIYLTSDVGIGVSETGNLAKKMRGAGVRNLMIGMGVLPGLTQGQFAAVLAHEYGHFSNKDTAGGNLANRVYGSLDQMIRGLAGGIAALPFNPVWLFVVAYSKIYFNVTLGAKRLQEVLADRFAALSMGSNLLIAGLTNIVKESIRFSLKANYEIKRSLEAKIGLSNLYDLPMNDEIQADFDEKYAERLEEKTSDLSSHPALQERIDRIGSYRAADKPIHLSDQPMLDLIPDAEELQMKMTGEIADKIPGL